MERMSNKEYRATLKELGISAYKAAALLGISKRASFYYATKREVPEPIAKLLRLIAAKKGSIEQVAEIMEARRG